MIIESEKAQFEILQGLIFFIIIKNILITVNILIYF